MGFPEIGAEASVYLKGSPSIRSSRRQFGIPGDTARVECIAFSVPKAKYVIWTFNGHEINTSNDHDYSILEDPLPEGIKSTLIVRESNSRHFGKYNCTVVNDYGNDTLEIELMAQSKFITFLLLSCISIALTCQHFVCRRALLLHKSLAYIHDTKGAQHDNMNVIHISKCFYIIIYLQKRCHC